MEKNIDWNEIITKATPEGATVDENILKAIVGAVETANNGLVNKNKELLGSLRDSKDNYNTVNEKLGQFEQQFKQLEINKQAESLKKDGNSDEFVQLKLNYDTIENNNKDLLNQIESLKSNYDGLQSKYKGSQIDLELNNAFDSVGVDEKFKPILMDAYRSKADGVLDGDKTRIVMQDGESQLSVTDFFQSWSKTEQAKAFIGANVNGGGSANGSSNRNGSNKPFSQMTLDERTDLFKTNPGLYNQLKTTK